MGGPNIFFAPKIDHAVVWKYQDVKAICENPFIFSSAEAQEPISNNASSLIDSPQADRSGSVSSLISLDPPIHGRIRSATLEALRKHSDLADREKVKALSKQLILNFGTSSIVDLVTSFADPLPAVVVFELLCIPEADWSELLLWCDHRSRETWSNPNAKQRAIFRESIAKYKEYLHQFIAAERRDDERSFVRTLLDCEHGLDSNEVHSVLYSLTFAGHETTKHLISNSILQILVNPAVKRSILEKHLSVEQVVNEVLRCESSVVSLQRTATETTELGGCVIPSGTRLFLWLFAANRDPDVFPNPNEFICERPQRPPSLAFGRGIHHCLGSSLGLAEAVGGISELLERFPNLELASLDKINYEPNLSFRGPKDLWVRLF